MKASLAAVLSDGDGRFVAGLMGVLVFLAVIATAAMLLIGGVADRWRVELGGRLTVQLPLEPGIAPGAPPATPEARVETALALLRAQPEVARAERVPEARLAALLQPWIGSAEGLQGLALPAVIEVELRPDGHDRAAGLRERLRVDLPDAAVDGGPAMLMPALRLMRGIEGLAILVVLVLAATLATAVVYATRARLARRQETVEMLHLLGAEEAGIVDALARGALRTALIGGGSGFALGALTLLAFGRLAAAGGQVQDDLALPLGAWAAIAALPLAAAAIAALTARIAARRVLQDLP